MNQHNNSDNKEPLVRLGQGEYIYDPYVCEFSATEKLANKIALAIVVLACLAFVALFVAAIFGSDIR